MSSTSGPSGHVPTILDRFDPLANSFNAIRLLAAFVVMVSHSYPLIGSQYEPFAARLGNYDTGGGWAVATFFTISGFLIARSAERLDIQSYKLARLLRILPALAVVVLLQTLLLGPLTTSLPISTYWTEAASSLWGVLLFPLETSLPGVFSSHPVPQVNGSLWTIPIEATFYALCLVLVVFGGLRKTGSVFVAGAFVVAYVWLVSHGYGWGQQGGEMFEAVPLYSGVKLGGFFFVGSAFWVCREKVPLTWPLALLALFFLWLARDGAAKPAAYILAWSYIVIFICLLPTFDLRKLIGDTDISYGLYLYAFPIQQLCVSALGGGWGPHAVTLLALPFTVLCAYLSWHYVERPCLDRKRRSVRSGQSEMSPAGTKT